MDFSHGLWTGLWTWFITINVSARAKSRKVHRLSRSQKTRSQTFSLALAASLEPKHFRRKFATCLRLIVLVQSDLFQFSNPTCIRRSPIQQGSKDGKTKSGLNRDRPDEGYEHSTRESAGRNRRECGLFYFSEKRFLNSTRRKPSWTSGQRLVKGS